MRYIYIVLSNNICTIHFVLQKEPSETEIDLMIDVTGLLYGDSIFDNVNYTYIITLDSINEITSNYFLLYAKYEE